MDRIRKASIGRIQLLLPKVQMKDEEIEAFDKNASEPHNISLSGLEGTRSWYT